MSLGVILAKALLCPPPKCVFLNLPSSVNDPNSIHPDFQRPGPRQIPRLSFLSFRPAPSRRPLQIRSAAQHLHLLHVPTGTLTWLPCWFDVLSVQKLCDFFLPLIQSFGSVRVRLSGELGLKLSYLALNSCLAHQSGSTALSIIHAYG